VQHSHAPSWRQTSPLRPHPQNSRPNQLRKASSQTRCRDRLANACSVDWLQQDVLHTLASPCCSLASF
jgi:hypothetical protein